MLRLPLYHVDIELGLGTIYFFTNPTKLEIKLGTKKKIVCLFSSSIYRPFCNKLQLCINNKRLGYIRALLSNGTF